jgi:CubicO group peptidase (beta-lactamase class C family)
MFLSRDKTSLRYASVLAALSLAVACGPDEPVTPVEVRIAQLENNLVPSFNVSGEPIIPQALSARMAHFAVPGVSIAVFEQGELSWAKGYGIADKESGRLVTADTLFQAASISKPVAALGALRLVEQGVLALDQDVNQRLRSWQVPDNEFTSANKVTLRGLLNHTVGTTVWGFPGYASEPIPSTVEVLQGKGNTDAITVYKQPGESWRYTGGGYTVMQLLMSDAAGMAFADIMEQFVLAPVGMTNSRYQQPLALQYRDQAAIAYAADGQPIGDGWHHYPELAAAGLWTTPTDLAKFAMRLQATFHGRRGRLLPRALAQLMLSPGMNNWGLGPELSEDRLRFGHGGSNQGFRCQFWTYIEDGTGIVVMTNSDGGEGLIGEIIASAASIYGWPGLEPDEKVVVELLPAQLQSVAGRYDLGPLGEVTIAVEAGQLIVRSLRQNQVVELRPMSDTEFFIADTGMNVTFVAEGGSIAALQLAGLRGERLQ